MTEQWIKWVPLPDLAKKYYIDALSDTEEGFTILLSESDNKQKRIKIIFKNSVSAYRITDETFRHRLICNLSDQYGSEFYGEWTFFKVLNSHYLQWLSEQSAGIADSLRFTHFSIIAADSILDIATTYEPKITLIHK